MIPITSIPQNPYKRQEEFQQVSLNLPVNTNIHMISISEQTNIANKMSGAQQLFSPSQTHENSMINSILLPKKLVPMNSISSSSQGMLVNYHH
jgi:hypothetical protein